MILCPIYPFALDVLMFYLPFRLLPTFHCSLFVFDLGQEIVEYFTKLSKIGFLWDVLQLNFGYLNL